MVTLAAHPEQNPVCHNALNRNGEANEAARVGPAAWPRVARHAPNMLSRTASKSERQTRNLGAEPTTTRLLNYQLGGSSGAPSRAYTQSLPTYTTPLDTVGDESIQPPVGVFQRTAPVTASRAYTHSSPQPM